nr:MAG TPA: transposase-like protein [Caudoviricetes sp.]
MARAIDGTWSKFVWNLSESVAVKFKDGKADLRELRNAVESQPALRPVSREQVEKVWRGEWNYSHTTETDHFAVVKCSKCGHEAFAIALYVKDGNFCPHCGAPMTDEAVEMVMERLEALNDGKGD